MKINNRLRDSTSNRPSPLRLFRKPAFRLILLCLVLLGRGAFWAPEKALSSDNYDHYFAIAADLLNKGMFLEALGMYEEISKNSENKNNRAQALLLMGTASSLYLDRYEAALEKFEAILKNYPDSPAVPEALFNSGIVFYETSDYKRAHAIFNFYIANYPGGRHRQSAEVWADSAGTQMNAPNSKTHPIAHKRIADTSIRVLLENNIKTTTVSSAETITVFDSFSGKKVYHGPGPLTFSTQDGFLIIGGRSIKSHMCRVTSEGTTIKLADRRYRGALMMSAGSEGINIVNCLPVESYLYGVLPQEMPYSWNPQALMAQAVAARTYALYIKRKSSDKAYDLEATTASQVYGGF
ncbi:MAG: tetratricopeptide repeat protein, partial [Proteobacteria bacterium]|nr:tetratricopeptide repeat protein [Pseudomonadota bacterium]